jgi:phage virion morphogenesis protein
MAEPLITIRYDDREVLKYFSRATRRFKDLRAPLQEIGEALLLSTDERWENEIDPSGRAWEDISPRTRATKRAKGRIDKILQDTGTGRASINYQADRFKLTVGTPLQYMANHQLGRGQEKREFLGISERDRAEILAIMRDYARG